MLRVEARQACGLAIAFYYLKGRADMNSRLLATLTVAAAVALAVLASQPQQLINAQPASKVQKWEYKMIGTLRRDPAEMEPKFNKVGNDGWEFVGMDGDMAIFKRPKI